MCIEECGRGWEVPLQYHWKLRDSWGASNGLRGDCGKGCLLQCCFPSFGASDIVVVGIQWALFEAGPKGVEAHQPSTLEKGSQRKEESSHHLHGPPADTRSTSWLSGVPNMANYSSWSLSLQADCIAFQLHHPPEEDYSSSWKLVYYFNQMLCYREYQLTTRFNQQNEKSTSNYTTRV